MLGLFKPRHSHKWEIVACNDKYSTSYTDTGKAVHWNQRFYKCNCGARKHEDNRPEFVSHAGISTAKKNWIDAGVVPSGSYDPSDASSGFIKIDGNEKIQDPLEKLNKSMEDLCAMMQVIKRDFELEKKYPKLKSIAERYNQELSKYRTFESLKGNDNVT